MVPSFQRSADFAVSKPAGEPCRWLADHRCTIHGSLGAKGYAGCVVFECFGAGQRLSAEAGAITPDGFSRAVLVHRVLWLLRWAGQALERAPAAAARHRTAVDRAFARLAAVELQAPPHAMMGEVDAANTILREVASDLRASSPGPREELSGAMLVGADLRERDLRGADLRGARLVGARLDGLDLALADLTGADLRGAALHGTDLRHALFLAADQVRAARWGEGTALPEPLRQELQGA